VPVWTVTDYTSSATSGSTQWIYPTWTTGATMPVTQTTITNAGTGSALWMQDASGAWQPLPCAQVTITYSYNFSAWNQPTAEQLEARRRREDARRREAGERMRRRAQVTARAEALLLSLLDEAQARAYTELGWFEVRGSAGGRFRIRRHGQAGNVDELEPASDKRIASYCIHPSGAFPDADAHVAQYLALVTDERRFREIANRTPRYRLPVNMAA
jgi:hypothetical protein